MYDFNSSLFRAALIGAVLSLPFKIIGIWRAARNEQKGWFAALLLINSLGLLELIYLFYFSRAKTKD